MLRYLHGLENTKDYIVKFINYVLLAEEKNQTKFYDGHKLLKFSNRPTAIKKNQWDFRRLPSLIVSSSDATLECISIEKDFLGNTSTYYIPTDDMPGPSGTDFEESGGEFNIAVRIDVYAHLLEECDKLTDLFATMFSSPIAKDFFLRHYVRLPNNLRINEGGAVNLPNIDTPVYYNSLNFTAYGSWRMREDMGPRLTEILYDLEFKQSLDFYLESVTVPDYRTVRLVFSDDFADNVNLYNISNYTFACPTVITASEITLVNSKTIDITIDGEMLERGSYLLKVSGIQDADGTTILADNGKAVFLGIGVLPTVDSAASTAGDIVRVVFDKAMGDGLTTASNYSFTCPAGAVITVVSIAQVDDMTVDITTAGEMEVGTNNYGLTVINVKDSIGNPIDTTNNTGTFNGLGVTPRVLSAMSTATDTIRVVFNEAMSDTGLTTNGNYAFTCPTGAVITVGSVTKINSTTVDITSVGEMLTGTANYTATVDNVTDVVGNIINPLYNSSAFNGLGVAPQVLSAAFVDADTCTVTFDSSMDTTSAQVPGNYVLSGPSAPVVSTATLVGNTVTLDLATAMISGDYTVTVSNVTDLVGNTIDPAHDSGTYTASIGSPKIILFGGEDAVGKNNETWEYDGSDWTIKSPGTNPSARVLHGMVGDSSRSVAFMFGGFDTAVDDETWTYSGSNWTLKNPGAKPTGRLGHGLAYDSTRNVIVLFGGFSSAFSDETWEYDGTTWAQKVIGGVPGVDKPSIRAYHNMTYDADRGVVVLFGGYTPGSGSVNDETWEYNGTTWTQRSPALKPSARNYSPLVYDSARQVVVLFGGSTATGRKNDTWEYNGTTWVLRNPGVKPIARREHALAYDADRSVIVLFGGDTEGDLGDVLMDDTWEYNGTVWTLISTTNKPSARDTHNMVYCIL